MKRFGIVTIVVMGFVAGIVFVYSCGGNGGSFVLAEITDVTGLEAGLEAINTSIQEIDNSTDVSGVVSGLNQATAAIQGITLSTNMSGVETRLDQLNTSIQGINPATSVNIDVSSIASRLDSITVILQIIASNVQPISQPQEVVKQTINYITDDYLCSGNTTGTIVNLSNITKLRLTSLSNIYDSGLEYKYYFYRGSNYIAFNDNYANLLGNVKMLAVPPGADGFSIITANTSPSNPKPCFTYSVILDLIGY